MLTPILFFCAFIPLLIVSLSVPILKTIFLFQLTALVTADFDSSAAGSVNFGVWGYCTSAINISVADVRDDRPATCSHPHLGYTFDSTVANALGVSGIENLVSNATTGALVLHPVACGLTFVALLISLLTLRRANASNRRLDLSVIGVGLLAAVVTTLVLLIDVIVIAVIRSKVHSHTDGAVSLNWGDAVWLVTAAVLVLWLAMTRAFATTFGCGRRRRQKSAA